MKSCELIAAVALCFTYLGCVGTTGGELFEIESYAAGVDEAALPFVNSRGYRVTLSEARVFVGGVYLNRSRPASVAADTSCTLAGVYVAEAQGGAEIDLLSPQPQQLPGRGVATNERALSGEVWLTRGDVDRVESAGEVLKIAGTAERDGHSLAFSGRLSIGKNRVIAPSNEALPGQNPICKQRIVSPIPVDLQGSPGDALLLRVDVRAMFSNVDFATLEQTSGGEHVFADRSGVNQASDNLFAGLRRASGVYQLSWENEVVP